MKDGSNAMRVDCVHWSNAMRVDCVHWSNAMRVDCVHLSEAWFRMLGEEVESMLYERLIQVHEMGYLGCTYHLKLGVGDCVRRRGWKGWRGARCRLETGAH